MALVANADIYASTRINMFFPANNQTGADGNLTGQCVTLVKWFMAEMANVPSPFAARGDARYVGHNLVAQGLADEIPAGQQRRGDIVTYEYGVYGHIAVMLSGGRIFQENANVAGATRRVLADGTVVYSSTVVPMYSSLGGVAPRFYRLKSYNEGGSDQMIIQNADNWYGRCRKEMLQIRGRDLSRSEFVGGAVGAEFLHWIEAVSDHPEADAAYNAQNVGQVAVRDDWQGQIGSLQQQVKDLSTRPTAEQLKAAQDQAASLQTQMADAVATAQAATDKANALETANIEAQKTGNAFLIWLGGILSKLKGSN